MKNSILKGLSTPALAEEAKRMFRWSWILNGFAAYCVLLSGYAYFRKASDWIPALFILAFGIIAHTFGTAAVNDGNQAHAEWKERTK